jgi:hypothetical protein
MGETRDETVANLRKRLGREPTKEEINTAREAVIRRADRKDISGKKRRL